ncbi:MAG: MFS transporter, partial [Lachnospiraceae bacterium]|nr:MFS transporter [Lachnospiraceae bacterium]
GYSAVISFVALYAVSNNIEGIGLFFTIGAIALFAARLMFAKLVDRFGYHIFVLVSTVLFAIVLVLIPHLHNIMALYAASIFYGSALGIVPMAVNAQVLERCSQKRRGTAMAAYTSSMDLGVAIGSILMGAVVDAGGFTPAFTLSGCICAMGAVVYALTVTRDHKKYVERMKAFNQKNTSIKERVWNEE